MNVNDSVPKSLSHYMKNFVAIFKINKHFSSQQLGIAMNGYVRTQLNIINGNLNFNDRIKRFSDLTVPIFWVEFVSKNF